MKIIDTAYPIDVYQDLASRTANTSLSVRDREICAGLGLAGEAGEVIDLLKKARFHGHELSDEKLTKELGDVLWYIAELASARNIRLSTVGRMNIEKLKARYPEGFSEEASRNRVESETQVLASVSCGEPKEVEEKCANCSHSSSDHGVRPGNKWRCYALLSSPSACECLWYVPLRNPLPNTIKK